MRHCGVTRLAKVIDRRVDMRDLHVYWRDIMKTVSTFSIGACRRGRTTHHRHSGAPPPRSAASREILDTAGDLLRALAAPVRIAIVLQLRESARCVHELVDALGGAAAAGQPASADPEGRRGGRRRAVGPRGAVPLVDHHLAHIVVDAVDHAARKATVTRHRARYRSALHPAARAISALLDKLDDFRSAQEFHDELRRARRGYRADHRLPHPAADGGRRPGRHPAHRHRRVGLPALLDEHHHHHLVCRVCGTTVEVQGGQVETWAAEVAREHGFTDVSHTIEIFGLCGACAPR